jgi:hypothetical protein
VRTVGRVADITGVLFDPSSLSLLADKKAAAHLKTVLGMVDEAAQSEGEGDGVEFLLHDGAHGPVRVYRAAECEPGPRQVNLVVQNSIFLFRKLKDTARYFSITSYEKE